MNLQKPPTIEEFLREVTRFMQVSCTLTATVEPEGVARFALETSEDGRLLIGKNGQNLNALEHVVRMVAMRHHPEQRSVLLDVNGYRAEQSQKLVEAVRAAAVRVQQTGRSEALEPMTSYQRRVVHTELAAYRDLSTESVGQDPHRRVVIKPL